MHMVRCDVKGCKSEYETKGFHQVSPPGWRHESATEVRMVPAATLQLPPGSVPPGMPEMVELPVHFEADICPNHPRSYELRAIEPPAPRLTGAMIAAA